jgi:hypothetical protein
MVALCHCSMCRRSAGAPAVAWAMFGMDQLTFISGELSSYTSSPGAERSFCSRCGTQLTFRADFLPGLVDVTVGSLDEPESLEPQMHIWDTRRIAWLETRDSWPRHAELPPWS